MSRTTSQPVLFRRGLQIPVLREKQIARAFFSREEYGSENQQPLAYQWGIGGRLACVLWKNGKTAAYLPDSYHLLLREPPCMYVVEALQLAFAHHDAYLSDKIMAPSASAEGRFARKFPNWGWTVEGCVRAVGGLALVGNRVCVAVVLGAHTDRVYTVAKKGVF